MSAQSAQSTGDEFFEKKIRPVLATNCFGCHSSKLKTPMGGLALDTKVGLLKGGDSGPAIVPGKPAESLLLRALRYNDLRLKMPPTDKLPDSVIADFERWIAAGAPDPRTEAVAATAAAKANGIDFDKGRQWWSFQPVRELPAPRVKQVAWPRTKTGRFILAKLEKNRLKPSAEADPRTLMRRAYLDLTGLKPSYEEIESYANDKDPKRYEKLIDRLLASPRYGERWGRYWLDVARYAENGDTGGNRQAYPYAWRYRDWVIEAFNHDVPYDRFLKQQLAADLMPGVSRNDLRALGYLGMAPSEWKEKMLEKELIDNLLLEEWDERVDAVGRGMLGLTVACARCHDHKFDPISQKDYYALAGVFASTSPAIRPLGEVDAATEARFLFARQRVSEAVKDRYPLVATPSDFGDRGAKPSHPELLDDLAARFIANGWSLKWLHREIMLSAAYRQSSKPRTDAAEIDAANQSLWRMNPRRLDAEAYRDSLLQAAGLLKLEMYGPSLDLDALDNMRRTVYGRINRGRTSDILRLYDFPNPFQHSPARATTITPLQELFVLNSPFMKQLSSALAKAEKFVVPPSGGNGPAEAGTTNRKVCSSAFRR
jgi:hypothetical protein